MKEEGDEAEENVRRKTEDSAVQEVMEGEVGVKRHEWD